MTTLLFAPKAAPVRNGRVSLARFGLPHGPLTCLSQYGGVLWLGATLDVPRLPGTVHRSEAHQDAKRRVTIPEDACAHLGVPSPHDFAVVIDRAPWGGVLLCPTDGYEMRKAGILDALCA